MNEQIYQETLANQAWRDLSHFGRFRISGADAAKLLHHLTTNDVKKLKPGAATETILVSHKARVLDWLTIVREAETLFVITSPNRRALFRPHAEKFILYRQDVKIEDVTDNTKMWGVFGPQAASAVSEAGESAISTSRLPDGGFFVLNDQFPRTPPCDDETYNTLRVEQGVPVTGLELTDAVNPWEANLNFAISLNKGCYNGQEVVARLNTYQKVQRRLMGLRLEQPIPLSQLAGTPAKLNAEARDAGFVTSSADSPRFGPIALAFVRGDFQTPGQVLKINAPDGAQNATVCELPFAG